MATEAKFIISASDKTKGAFASVGKSLKNMGKTLIGVKGGIAALVGVGGMGAFIKISADAARVATSYADALGIGTQKMQAWQYAAKSVNLEGDKMADIMKDVSDKFGDAFANNAGAAKDVMTRMKLDFGELAAMSPDQQLLKIAEGFGQIQTRSEKIQILESLGSDASLLLPLLENNAEKLRALTDEAVSTGAAMSDVDAAKLQAANISLQRTQSIIIGVGQSFAVALSPYIQAVAEWFVETAKQSGGFGAVAVKAVGYAAKAVGILADGWRGMEVIWLGLKATFWGFSSAVLEGVTALGRSIENLVNGSIKMVTGPLATMLEKLGRFSDKAKEMSASLKSIEGIGITDAVGEMWQEAAQKGIQAQTELHELLMKPLPSGNIDEWFARVQDASQKAAEHAAGVKAGIAGLDAGGGGMFLDPTEQLDQQLASRLEKIREAGMTENEILREKYLQQQIDIEASWDAGLIKERERYALLQQLESQHQQAIVAMNKQANQQIVELRKGATGQLIGLMQTLGSKHKGFAIAALALEKGQAIAETFMATQTAAAKALAVYGPTPQGFAAAAAAETFGYLKMGLIAATGFAQAAQLGSGGASPGSPANPIHTTGSGNGVSGASIQQERVVREVRLDLGDDDRLLSVGQMRKFLEEAKEAADDMGGDYRMVIA